MFRLVTVAAEDVAASKATALAESTARMFATLNTKVHKLKTTHSQKLVPHNNEQ
jgi:phage gp16-like protein